MKKTFLISVLIWAGAVFAVVASMAWLDGTCRDYIGWLVDQAKEVKDG